MEEAVPGGLKDDSAFLPHTSTSGEGAVVTTAQEPVLVAPTAETVTRTRSTPPKEEEGDSLSVTMDESLEIRRWFTSLPSGAERAAVVSISDPAFLKLFLGLVNAKRPSMGQHAHRRKGKKQQAMQSATFFADGDDSFELNYISGLFDEYSVASSRAATSSFQGSVEEPEFASGSSQSAPETATVGPVAVCLTDLPEPRQSSTRSEDRLESSVSSGVEPGMLEVCNGPLATTSTAGEVEAPPRTENENAESKTTLKTNAREWEDGDNRKDERAIESTAFRIRDEPVGEENITLLVTENHGPASPSSLGAPSSDAVVSVTKDVARAALDDRVESSSSAHVGSVTRTESPTSVPDAAKNEDSIGMMDNADDPKAVETASSEPYAAATVTAKILPTEQNEDAENDNSAAEPLDQQPRTDSLVLDGSGGEPSSSKTSKNAGSENGVVVAESKNIASRALSSRRKGHHDRETQGNRHVRRVVHPATQQRGTELMDLVRIVFTSVCDAAVAVSESQFHLKHPYGGKGEPEAREGAEILTLDPGFLDRVGGEEFLLLADDIINAEPLWKTRFDTTEENGFLSESSWSFLSSKDRLNHQSSQSTNSWFQWMGSCVGSSDGDRDTNASAVCRVPLHVLLMARIELSIWESYRRHARRKGLPVGGEDLSAAQAKENAKEKDAKPSAAVKGLGSYLRSTSSAGRNQLLHAGVVSHHHAMEEEGSSTEQWATPPEEEEDDDHEGADGNSVSSLINLGFPGDEEMTGQCHPPAKAHERMPPSDGFESNGAPSPHQPSATPVSPKVLIDVSCPLDSPKKSHPSGCSTSVEGVLPDVLSLRRKLKMYGDSARSTSLIGLMDPVMQMIKVDSSNDRDASRLENLVLTPLAFLVRSMCLHNESLGKSALMTKIDTCVQTWNKTLRGSIQQVMDLLNEPEGRGEMAKSKVQKIRQPEHQTDCTSSAATGSVSTKEATTRLPANSGTKGEESELRGGNPSAGVSFGEEQRPINDASSLSSPLSSKTKKKKKKKKKRKSSNAAEKLTPSQRTDITDTVTDVSCAASSSGGAEGVSKSKREEVSVQGGDGVLRNGVKVALEGIKYPPGTNSDALDSDRKLSEKKNEAIPSKAVPSKPAKTPVSAIASDITVARVEGVGTTCVVVEKIGLNVQNSTSAATGGDHKDNPGSTSEAKHQAHEDENGSGSQWEKVEAKGRGGRGKKSSEHHRHGHGHGAGRFSSLHSTSGTARDGGNLSNQGFNSSSGNAGTGASSRKAKGGRTAASRRRVAHRKIVRDILSSVLDSVEEEVSRRRKEAARAFVEERRRVNDEKKRVANANRLVVQSEKKVAATSSAQTGGNANNHARSGVTRAASLRDVVVGSASSSGGKSHSSPPTPNPSRADKHKGLLAPSKAKPPSAAVSSLTTQTKSGGIAAPQSRKDGAKLATLGAGGAEKSKRRLHQQQGTSSTADQSTAPTLPETLSGVSANTQSTSNTEGEGRPDKNRFVEYNEVPGALISAAAADDSISEATDEQQKPQTAKAGDQDASPPPPLPTLLGPGNANSASSSVASSLDAPHATRHHRSSSLKENDVGYHLLGVCDRLSEDMNTFMGRRALALSVRRRERGALLSALQDSVTKLWVGRCHVEMYGSCATQLDLPSSDLDVVICGLDRMHESVQQSPNGVKSHKSKTKKHQQLGSPGESETLSNVEDVHQSTQPLTLNQQHYVQNSGPPHHHGFPAQSPNAGRVLRLAGELERQAWAVQVKAIPTASVPVIKILADPSRLPGAASASATSGDWMMQQQHMAAQAAAAAAAAGITPPSSQPLDQQTPSRAGYYASNHSAAAAAAAVAAVTHHATMGLPRPTPSPYHTPPPWRGADVMNGLISVDVTFEGPEHGGIGSTAYSARVVQDACNETGLPPESTAAVQVTMVLKELLAQRRLNEPFSGGLSSYALLLLVVAVMRERRTIREEMERVEKHRRAVAAGGGNSTGAGTGASVVSSSVRSSGDLGVVDESTDIGGAWSVPESKPDKRRDQHPVPSFASVTLAKSAPSAPLSAGRSSVQHSHDRQQEQQQKPKQQPKQQQRQAHGEKKKKKARSSPDDASSPSVTSAGAGTSTSAVAGASTSAASAHSWASIAKKSSTSQVNKSPPVSTRPQPKTKPTPRGSTATGHSPKQGQKQKESHQSKGAVVSSGSGSLCPTVADKKASTSSSLTSNISGRTLPRGSNNVTAESQGSQDSCQRAEQGTETVAVDSSTASAVASDSAVAGCLQAGGVCDDNEAHVRNVDNSQPSFSQRFSDPVQTAASTTLPLGGGLVGGQPLFPQGSNDVLEVLCSGEPTAGKLLMHFLLFYGQHFDAQTTSIDVGGTHHPEYHLVATHKASLHQLSPFVQRRAGGTIDPITGMFTVDPLVVYDPLEGAENTNVARSCFAWSSIRWVFAQSYMTLSSAVERSGTSPSSASVGAAVAGVVPGDSLAADVKDRNSTSNKKSPTVVREAGGNNVEESRHATIDAVSPLLELLLSF